MSKLLKTNTRTHTSARYMTRAIYLLNAELHTFCR